MVQMAFDILLCAQLAFPPGSSKRVGPEKVGTVVHEDFTGCHLKMRDCQAWTTDDEVFTIFHMCGLWIIY